MNRPASVFGRWTIFAALGLWCAMTTAASAQFAPPPAQVVEPALDAAGQSRACPASQPARTEGVVTGHVPHTKRTHDCLSEVEEVTRPAVWRAGRASVLAIGVPFM